MMDFISPRSNTGELSLRVAYCATEHAASRRHLSCAHTIPELLSLISVRPVRQDVDMDGVMKPPENRFTSIERRT